MNMADLDSWVEIARECKYLPENDLKKLCDIVCDLLLEESNIQPVSTPVTVCGDIHGQVNAQPVKVPIYILSTHTPEESNKPQFMGGYF